MRWEEVEIAAPWMVQEERKRLIGPGLLGHTPGHEPNDKAQHDGEACVADDDEDHLGYKHHIRLSQRVGET